MTVFKKPKCSECKFFQLKGLVCRRYPKQVYYTQLGHKVDFTYPQVDPEDWCGEFIRKGIKH